MNLLVPNGFEANYTLGFARGLAANRIPVHVISDDLTAAPLQAAGIPHTNLRGSQQHGRSFWSKTGNLARYYARVAATIFAYRSKTIHFTGLLTSRFILLEGIMLPPWIRFWSRCYIHTAHNALPHGQEGSRLFRMVYRWIYRFPHVIVAHTAKIAHQLQTEFGVDERRLVVISIGLNEEIPPTTLSQSQARQRLGLSEGPLALFFGKIERYKGVDTLIDAWSQMHTSAARLAIVGSCSDVAYGRKIQTRLASSPRTAEISWRNEFIGNEEIAVWMAACDVVVLPYRHIYQSGIVFLCLRFGVPVVATDVGSLAEYIEPHCGIIAEANDPAGFARAIDTFFVQRDIFSRDTIARSAVKYQWTKQCAKIAHLYDGT